MTFVPWQHRWARKWPRSLAEWMAVVAATALGLLIARATTWDAILLTAMAVVGGATLIEPLVGVGAFLFLGPLWAYLRAEVPEIPTQIAQVFVALTLVAWLARGLARRDVRVPRSPIILPLAIFIAGGWFSLTSPWNRIEQHPELLFLYGVLELVKWMQIPLIALVVADLLAAERRRVLWLVGILLAVGLFQASVGIYQFGLRGDGPDHFAILGGRFYRAYGTFEQPNPFAGYVGTTLALALGVAWGLFTEVGTRIRRRGWRRGMAWPEGLALLTTGIVCVGMGAALVMSWSRGAWLGFGAALVMMAIALPRRTQWGIMLVIVMLISFIVLYRLGALPPSLTERLTGFVQDVRFEDVRGVGINDANYAVIERLAHWQAALDMWRYRFWTGVGLGCYEPAYPDFALINWPIPLGHAHNYYLNLAAETGLIGLGTYLLLWGWVFWQTWRVTRRAVGLPRGIAIGLLGVWTHWSIHHSLDNLYVNNVHLHVAVWLGLLAWVILTSTKNRGNGGPWGKPASLTTRHFDPPAGSEAVGGHFVP